MEAFLMIVEILSRLMAGGALCTASWYGQGFHGRLTSCGEIYDCSEMSTAHRELPMGTLLWVVSEDTSVVVIVNDRGPHIAGRELDLSTAAFKVLAGGCSPGLVRVRYWVVGRNIRPTMRYNMGG